MLSLPIVTKSGPINGFCDNRFREVAEVFAENFETRDEIGASVCIMIDGVPVVDLWGGSRADGSPWECDTVCVVFSCTKGASALCAHMAADRGLLDLDAPVSRYWPEFARNGKENALVSMMLDHSVGLPGIRAQLKDGGACDYDYMVEQLQAEAPFWKPGTRHGYHGLTSAWTVGEMVHRSTGKRLGQFFADEVARPLGIDFWIGLPDEIEPRLSMIIPGARDPESRISIAMETDPMGPTGRFVLNTGNFNANDRKIRAAEIGSAAGVSNARGLAELYNPLANGGRVNGVSLVGEESLRRMSSVSVATHEDATLMVPTRFSLGFMKSVDNRALPNSTNCSMMLSEDAFGHVGAGGSIGFASPDAKMSFGYAMNRQGDGVLMNDRGQSLIDAAYRALG
ncbi:MAG: serine hydrolase domain-containing protein [Terriglobia bacterium]|nr:serine hydrolase domain-containing protein [Terriglobia bacterium]